MRAESEHAMSLVVAFLRFVLLGLFLWGIAAIVLRLFLVDDEHTAWAVIAFAWVAAGYDTVRKTILDRRKASQGPFACLHCGYDLRATPERCPECGYVVSRRP